jgi:hypothetical protein
MENPDDDQHEHMSGHALMASAAPYSHIIEHPADPYPHQMPEEMSPSALSKLLALSSRLPKDVYNREGEITPVMAWSMIFQHERIGDLTEGDVEKIKKGLEGKVRCYG